MEAEVIILAVEKREEASSGCKGELRGRRELDRPLVLVEEQLTNLYSLYEDQSLKNMNPR